ncbi:MAG TPA: hypothetical protein VNQ99_14140 [Xanthobacteraceae bacterium]|nr:hypothetical protein [Xanthobacteraceae bacterium]
MRRFFMAIVSGSGILFLSAFAHGQAPVERNLPPPTESARVNLTMEQQHIITEVVKEMQLPPELATVPEEVGATVPEPIVLHMLPQVAMDKIPQIRSHRFIYKDGKVLLVDPRDRTIAAVLG